MVRPRCHAVNQMLCGSRSEERRVGKERDWSSDVCSSDLGTKREARAPRTIRMRTERPGKENEKRRRRKRSFREEEKPLHAAPVLDNPHRRCSAWLGRVVML